MIHGYSGCSIEQIRRRFFATPGARSACYARVSLLVEEKYLAASRLPSLTGVGSGKMFLILGSRGRQVVAHELEISRSELARTSRAVSPFMLAHHLAIA